MKRAIMMSALLNRTIRECSSVLPVAKYIKDTNKCLIFVSVLRCLKSEDAFLK